MKTTRRLITIMFLFLCNTLVGAHNNAYDRIKPTLIKTAKISSYAIECAFGTALTIFDIYCLLLGEHSVIRSYKSKSYTHLIFVGFLTLIGPTFLINGMRGLEKELPLINGTKNSALQEKKVTEIAPQSVTRTGTSIDTCIQDQDENRWKKKLIKATMVAWYLAQTITGAVIAQRITVDLKTPDTIHWASFSELLKAKDSRAWKTFIFDSSASIFCLINGVTGLAHELQLAQHSKPYLEIIRTKIADRGYNKMPANLLNSLRSLVSRKTDPKIR